MPTWMPSRPIFLPSSNVEKACPREAKNGRVLLWLLLILVKLKLDFSFPKAQVSFYKEYAMKQIHRNLTENILFALKRIRVNLSTQWPFDPGIYGIFCPF